MAFLPMENKLSFEKEWITGKFKNKIVTLNIKRDGDQIYYEGREIDGDNMLGVVYRKFENNRNNELELEFERQKELARNQFKQDLSILAYNMSPESCKRTYEMKVGPIIKKSIGKPVDMQELGYFELYLNHPQFCDLFNNDEVKLVYDRFYAKYPPLKPDGYDQINFANFTRNRSTENGFSNYGKYDHDLFEKRKIVYNATYKHIHTIIEQGTFTPKQWIEFKSGISDANFCFGFKSKIVQNLNQIEKQASLLIGLEKELETLPEGDERNRCSGNISKQRSWFENNFKLIMNDFNPYLDLSSIK